MHRYVRAAQIPTPEIDEVDLITLLSPLLELEKKKIGERESAGMERRLGGYMFKAMLTYILHLWKD